MVATDWNTPSLADEYSDFRGFIKTQLEHLGLKDFDVDTNIPTGFIRLNPSTDIEERYTGASWIPTNREAAITSHMADTALHSGVPIGTPIVWLTASPPTNYLMMNGQNVSRTTYATLFALWSTTFGMGDGSTTFGIPDWRGKIPIMQGVTSPTDGPLGNAFGSLNHVHSGPAHTHTINGHDHTLAAHTHLGGAHNHSTPNHTHTIPAHYHAVTGNGATINITSSAAHQHNYGTKSGSTIAGSGGNRALNASSSGANETNQTSADGSGVHVHANGDFAGFVGNVSSGILGDGTMTSSSNNGGNTGSGGAVATGGPSYDGTSSVGLTTNSGGTGDTATANPPCIICNWVVKAL